MKIEFEMVHVRDEIFEVPKEFYWKIQNVFLMAQLLGYSVEPSYSRYSRRELYISIHNTSIASYIDAVLHYNYDGEYRHIFIYNNNEGQFVIRNDFDCAINFITGLL